ncbi:MULTISPECIES: phage tail protein [Brevibacillus]|uniref:phage tail protein n=1 Tax=Brevibacillus TaxID=55080 RepID=UPI0007ABD5EF|nr:MULTISPECIES: tail fiber protein [Brevibacillus]KZE43354.1 phage tail protein [Brevibacillus parabrevis]UED69813.1 tail fiber protein [Brevibacillus sp. HD3.3A]
MSESYLGEVRMFAGNFAPQGWALCNGQLLSIAENEALFALLGTTYGGDGQTTFALPDLQGRVPVHPNSNYVRGSKSGTETVTLVSNQLPVHTHTVNAIADYQNDDTPANNVWSKNPMSPYSVETSSALSNMNPQSVSPVGGGQPHNNMMPTTAISFIISLYGVFPPQP